MPSHAGRGRNHDIEKCQVYFKGELERIYDEVFVGPTVSGDA